MLNDESRLELPEAPGDAWDQGVAAWSEPVVIDTYQPLAPTRFPLYLDRRVYQGSSGRVYPMPFHERIDPVKRPKRWQAVHLENEWLRVMVLPDLGGRIHVGLDKTRGYDFFYRNNVVKPALVGLLGPWISGGVELNWPQHHRPATFLPTDVTIEREPDGSATVWCADLDPFMRLKGMHGVRLRPESAVVELRVRLYNRTDSVQTFLWWANVAAPVNDHYQSFFPADVRFVADHAKRAVVSFPHPDARYYGVDYAARVDEAHPDADRLDWFRNIPVPTSYMGVGSRGDHFGGYDHRARAGFVHVADHRISPGKKQWTWGNAPFGRAWDRNLTDGDGPYIELMAGVYTDNQPDFSFLAPGETKTFTQCWYPIQEIGPADVANAEAALSAEVLDGAVRVGVAVTRRRPQLTVTVHDGAGDVVGTASGAAEPGRPLLTTVAAGTGAVRVVVRAGDDELIAWSDERPPAEPAPAPATEPVPPEQLATVEELYLTGLHLEQYRHATRSPEVYWQEALRRDPDDSRVCTALARRRHDAGLLDEAEALANRAVARLTARNPNPRDGEPFYRLGLVLRDQGRTAEAYDVLAKASWNAPWRVGAWTVMATIDLAAGRAEQALDLTGRVLGVESGHLRAVALRVLALRALGRHEEARAAATAARAVDPLDWWLRDLLGERLDAGAQLLLDVALEYAACGSWTDAFRLLDAAAEAEATRPVLGEPRLGPLVGYHRAHVLAASGDVAGAAAALDQAPAADVAWCFPGRLADALVLEWAIGQRPADGVARGLLGHWLYAQGRHADAVESWRRADPEDPVVARNLGIAAWNDAHDAAEAAARYARALALAPDDARLLSERDQLARRSGEDPAARLERLAARPDLVSERDDLSAQLAVLLTLTDDPAAAVAVLGSRTFQPWEGGEGVVLGAWDLAQLDLCQRALAAGDASAAEAAARAALDPPANLGEGRHLLANRADLDLALGDASALAGDGDAARASWLRAATADGDFLDMAPTAVSEKTVFSVLAWQRLGEHVRAGALLEGLDAEATVAKSAEATIDYFATSLPTLLLFDDDLTLRRRVTARILRAQAAAVRGDHASARRLCDEVRAIDPCNPHLHVLQTSLLREVRHDRE
ncbi:DUF5107 domain-containing protein [Cellulomonas sp. NTE-D12]|uniref:DUF5107 domain-containing protein n=1 Tax=Cellulomonas sp. NTE-D12 TaxID=2962632 RepID=UPI0030817E36|nr:hypothetical protein CELD12_33310 [Cellulomonas sp. NTE-D12]